MSTKTVKKEEIDEKEAETVEEIDEVEADEDQVTPLTMKLEDVPGLGPKSAKMLRDGKN